MIDFWHQILSYIKNIQINIKETRQLDGLLKRV